MLIIKLVPTNISSNTIKYLPGNCVVHLSQKFRSCRIKLYDLDGNILEPAVEYDPGFYVYYGNKIRLEYYESFKYGYDYATLAGRGGFR